MSRFAAIAAASLLLSSSFLPSSSVVATDACDGDDYGTAGQFDFYILEFSWPADFCLSHSSEPGCSNPTAWQQTNFTLHGMWPNFAASQGTHDWPQCCDTGSGADLDPTVITNLLSSLQTYWPSEQNPDPVGDLSNSLWAHEWAKHGTCSGIDQNTYFNAAMTLIATPEFATPAIVTSNIGGSVNPNDIESAFNNGTPCVAGTPCLVGLTCEGASGSESLSGLQTCWTQDWKQILCPVAVLGKGCEDSTISIASFSQVAKKRSEIKRVENGFENRRSIHTYKPIQF